MTARISADQHRKRGTPAPYHRQPAPRPERADRPAADPPEPLEPLGQAGARLWAWCWQTWGDVLDADDALTITNLARLADAATDMDALYDEAEPGKRAMAGRLRVSARLRFTNELARLTARVETHRKDR